MRFTSMYLMGYAIFVAGLIAALWKLGILERLGTTWTLIGVVTLIGLGIMLAVGNDKKVVEMKYRLPATRGSADLPAELPLGDVAAVLALVTKLRAEHS